MKQKQAQSFIENNRDVLKTLSEKIRALDTVHFASDNVEVETLARRKAVETITEWISELFSVAYDVETAREVSENDKGVYYDLMSSRQSQDDGY